MRQFRVRFNKGRQYAIIHIGEPIKQFRKANKCWAWYVSDRQRKYSGLMGHIHLPSMHGMKRVEYRELIVHEIDHLFTDWILSRARGLSFIVRNEELLATMKGQMYKRICNRLGV